MFLVLKTALQRSPATFCRSFSVAAANFQKKDQALEQMKFKMAGFYKYGLLQDDLLTEYDSDVEEAVRRLPEELRLARIYRAITASQAEISHSILPEEQWTKFDDDHHYLQPYLEEVRREREERREWEATH